MKIGAKASAFTSINLFPQHQTLKQAHSQLHTFVIRVHEYCKRTPEKYHTMVSIEPRKPTEYSSLKHQRHWLPKCFASRECCVVLPGTVLPGTQFLFPLRTAGVPDARVPRVVRSVLLDGRGVVRLLAAHVAAGEQGQLRRRPAVEDCQVGPATHASCFSRTTPKFLTIFCAAWGFEMYSVRNDEIVPGA